MVAILEICLWVFIANIALIQRMDTARVMRVMLGNCDDLAQEYAIAFNVKKTKCFWVQQSSASKFLSCIKPDFLLSALEFIT